MHKPDYANRIRGALVIERCQSEMHKMADAANAGARSDYRHECRRLVWKGGPLKPAIKDFCREKMAAKENILRPCDRSLVLLLAAWAALKDDADRHELLGTGYPEDDTAAHSAKPFAMRPVHLGVQLEDRIGRTNRPRGAGDSNSKAGLDPAVAIHLPLIRKADSGAAGELAIVRLGESVKVDIVEPVAVASQSFPIAPWDTRQGDVDGGLVQFRSGRSKAALPGAAKNDRSGIMSQRQYAGR